MCTPAASTLQPRGLEGWSRRTLPAVPQYGLAEEKSFKPPMRAHMQPLDEWEAQVKAKGGVLRWDRARRPDSPRFSRPVSRGSHGNGGGGEHGIRRGGGGSGVGSASHSAAAAAAAAAAASAVAMSKAFDSADTSDDDANVLPIAAHLINGNGKVPDGGPNQQQP